ncbi:hypothetical protein CGMCC3_g3762 [Colletotrichum fructicola]|uniref:Ankyrin repeat protein n=1 Tax=Colletotrichum fructicola (strain Nara gc5) TaxID=1213859 RepID=L2FH99_COLFN|nr:uncharacterized protein CGMCC3_g3762 [Colletotrichum fructicola]KAE9580303.1 hypothetical protein CGMCC3_g3762 [Colletotrichum fructicola]KAF4479798.1 hypothetical protein CGGC5_v011924 [Colletotrichum fructicola Nara gc5]
MEVIGGATAVLQLVVALSKTVQVTSSAYHDIRRIDDRIEDIESQLEATRFHLKLLENCISSGTFGEHICRYAELVPVIKSCDRAYTRLSDIFVKIHRDRSWATAVRTGTPTSGYSTFRELMAQELHIQQNKFKETEHGGANDHSNQEALADQNKGSQTSFSARQASMATLTSSATAAERLSRVSSTLVGLQLDEPQDTNVPETASRTGYSDLQIDMEMLEETRSMIMATQGLCGSIKDAATTLDAKSMLSGPMSPLSRNTTVRTRRSPYSVAPIEKATGFSSQSLADELNQRRIKHAEQMITSNQFSKAIPHLVRVLDGQPGSEKDPRLIRMLAKALGETDPNSKDAEILCKRYPSLVLHLDAQRLVQAEILLAEPNLGGVVRLLQSYGTTQAKGFAYDDVNINIRLILSTALVQLSQADEALLILSRLSQREELDPAQTSDVHRLLAETYALKSDLDHAKSHCMQAIELNMEVRSRDDERTLACLSLMVDVCRKTMDPDEDIWKDMLPEGPERTVRASASIGEISVSSSNPAQKLHALYRDMVEMAITDVGAAADLGTDFLRKNYCVDALSAKWYPNQPKKAGQICFDCIRRNIIEMVNMKALPLTPQTPDMLCTFHQKPADTWTEFRASSGSYLPCYSLLSFFSIADPIPDQWLGRDGAVGCVKEIEFLLTLGSPHDRMLGALVNTPEQFFVPQKNADQSDQARRIVRTPLWMAATFGQKAVVEFLLSLDVTDLSQPSCEGLLAFPPCNPQGREIVSKINTSVTTLINKASQKQALQLLRAAHGMWRYNRLPVYEALLEKGGPGAADQPMQPPNNKRSSTSLFGVFRGSKSHDSDELLLPPVCGVVRTWVDGSVSRFEPLAVLQVLKKHGADFRATDEKGRTAFDFALREAKKCLKESVVSGLKYLDDNPPLLKASGMSSVALSHIKVVQYLRSAL